MNSKVQFVNTTHPAITIINNELEPEKINPSETPTLNPTFNFWATLDTTFPYVLALINFTTVLIGSYYFLRVLPNAEKKKKKEKRKKKEIKNQDEIEAAEKLLSRGIDGKHASNREYASEKKVLGGQNGEGGEEGQERVGSKRFGVGSTGRPKRPTISIGSTSRLSSTTSHKESESINIDIADSHIVADSIQIVASSLCVPISNQAAVKTLDSSKEKVPGNSELNSENKTQLAHGLNILSSAEKLENKLIQEKEQFLSAGGKRRASDTANLRYDKTDTHEEEFLDRRQSFAVDNQQQNSRPPKGYSKNYTKQLSRWQNSSIISEIYDSETRTKFTNGLSDVVEENSSLSSNLVNSSAVKTTKLGVGIS